VSICRVVSRLQQSITLTLLRSLNLPGLIWTKSVAHFSSIMCLLVVNVMCCYILVLICNVQYSLPYISCVNKCH